MGGSEGFGERLLRSRLMLGARRGRAVSQSDLAAELGVSGVTVGRYEAGTSEPTLAVIERLAEVLGVDPAWLAFGDKDAQEQGAEQAPVPRPSMAQPAPTTGRAKVDSAARQKRRQRPA